MYNCKRTDSTDPPRPKLKNYLTRRGPNDERKEKGLLEMWEYEDRLKD